MFNWKNWVKVTWWSILLAGVAVLMVFRCNAIINGDGTNVDVILFLVFLALSILPIVSEVNILGVKLKQEIKDIKDSVDKINMNLNQNVTTHNYFGSQIPQTDYPLIISKLDELTKLIDTKESSENIKSPDDNTVAFYIRFNIEQELRRIYKQQLLSDGKLRSIRDMTSILADKGIISDSMLQIMRDVISVCNRGIHDVDFGANNANFIREAGSKIISYLKSV